MVEKFWLKSYDAHVKPPLTYPTDDLGTILTAKMKEFPNKIAIYFMDAEYTYEEVLGVFAEVCDIPTKKWY